MGKVSNSTIERRTPLKSGGRVKPVNAKRKAKRYAVNYGEKADFVRAQRCYVTGRTDDIVAAHPVPKGRSKAEGLVPFNGEVEVDWHGLDEARWNRKYARFGKTKQMCREAAAMYEEMWQCELRGEPYHLPF